MRHKAIALVLVILALTSIKPSEAQQAKKYPVLGYLSSGDQTGESARAEAIRLALRERGYIEGQTIATEYRYAEGNSEKYREFAAELVGLKVDIIIAAGGAATIRAAKNATKTIPIVMMGSGLDPVEAGLVESLSRPGGNITGLTSLVTHLPGKRLELFKAAVPKFAVVGVIYHPATASSMRELKEVQTVAPALKLSIRPWEIRTTDDFEKVFAAANKQRPDGIYVSNASLMTINRNRIVSLALKNRLPSMFSGREAVESGALLYYGPDLSQTYQRVAYYVDRILRGTNPADLPVEQPTKLELVINLKTAKQIGLTIPQSVLYRADKVIR
jgi:putative tryptophan/tyrosine transport system substrate-binding protein